MNYHAKFQGKILQNIDFIKCLVSYDFFLDHGVDHQGFYQIQTVKDITLFLLLAIQN